MPAAASTRMASGAARASPPWWPRVAIDRMNTPCVEGVALHADAVAENGATGVGRGRVDGQHADPTRPRPGPPVISRAVRVDFPAPGAPVMPMTCSHVGSSGRR